MYIQSLENDPFMFEEITWSDVKDAVPLTIVFEHSNRTELQQNL